MKIESEKVEDLIKIFRSYFDGVIETVRIGNDGFQESCQTQKEAAIEEILNWKAINIPTEKIEKINHWKLKDFDELNPQERWASSLNSYLIRRIKSDENIGDISNNDLFAHIENYLEHTEAKAMKDGYYNVFVRTGIKVVQEIVEQIIQQRAKAPQKKLF